MSTLALIISHTAHAGKRDDVRRVWETYMAPAIASNPDHVAYFYCFDNGDPDSISAFQLYTSLEASEQFLRTHAYAEYLRHVEPLLVGPPRVTTLTPVWTKIASQSGVAQ